MKCIDGKLQLYPISFKAGWPKSLPAIIICRNKRSSQKFHTPNNTEGDPIFKVGQQSWATMLSVGKTKSDNYIIWFPWHDMANNCKLLC